MAPGAAESAVPPPAADALEPDPASLPPGDDDALDTAREAVLALLGPSAVSVDELVRECQFSAPVVTTVLLELELAGRLERQPGGRVALRLGAD